MEPVEMGHVDIPTQWHVDILTQQNAVPSECSHTRVPPTTLCEGTVPVALWSISRLFSTALIA